MDRKRDHSVMLRMKLKGFIDFLMSDYSYPVNLGNPNEITILEFAEEIIKLTGTTQKIIFKPLPTDDPIAKTT